MGWIDPGVIYNIMPCGVGAQLDLTLLLLALSQCFLYLQKHSIVAHL